MDDQQQAARDWFESLRDRICTAFEAIEREAGSEAAFTYTNWDRPDPDGAPGGGGVRGVMKGQVFEKVGVNVSTVGGSFSPEFAATIHGAAEDPSFFATGISLVAHMATAAPGPHDTASVTTGAGRRRRRSHPPIPYDEDRGISTACLRGACAATTQHSTALLEGARTIYIAASRRASRRGAFHVIRSGGPGEGYLRKSRLTRDTASILDMFRSSSAAE